MSYPRQREILRRSKRKPATPVQRYQLKVTLEDTRPEIWSRIVVRGDMKLGLLDDALPLFGSASALPRAGVLLAIPALVHSGIFECAQKIYGSLGPAFFGLRTTILILLLMALWRIKRPEALKEHSPAALGRVLGVDRASEVKTLRRTLARLASYQRAAQFGRALAEQRGSALCRHRRSQRGPGQNAPGHPGRIASLGGLASGNDRV